MSPYPKGSNLDLAIKPGDHLIVLLRENNISRLEFAKMTGIPIKYIRDLISGKVQLTAKAAIRFEKVFEFSADLWMRIEALYQLRLAYENEYEFKRKKLKKSTSNSVSGPQSKAA